VTRKCECYATISEKDPRYEIWKQIDPEARMPLKHPLTRENLTIYPGLFYEGDATRLTTEQKELLAKLMSEEFKIPKAEVLKNLADGVFPIKADNVIVSICNLHMRCML
jgi:hypothetical protein